MSKRKRASLGKTSTGADKPAGAEDKSAADDAAVKEDMAHVRPDMLAGSPDIFAPKWTDPPAPPASADVVTEPVVAEQPSDAVESPAESLEAAPLELAPVLAPEPVAAPPPPPVSYMPPPVRPRGGGSSAALGIVLVLVIVWLTLRFSSVLVRLLRPAGIDQHAIGHRHDRAAQGQPGADKAEHLADLAGRGGVLDHHVARRAAGADPRATAGTRQAGFTAGHGTKNALAGRTGLRDGREGTHVASVSGLTASHLQVK